uniref:Uncharacterized protein n=2 Tax=Leersia perrieri TaxID=77586 RepID=A0A0D9XD02_9ORYZ
MASRDSGLWPNAPRARIFSSRVRSTAPTNHSQFLTGGTVAITVPNLRISDGELIYPKPKRIEANQLIACDSAGRARPMNLFLSATSVISDANNWFEFIGTAFSAVSELLLQWRRKQEYLQGQSECRQLKWKDDEKMKQLRYCMLGLPDLIKHAEWLSYVKCDKEVTELLSELKIRLYDAYDLLEEFRYHHHQLQLGSDAQGVAEQLQNDFLQNITDGSIVRDILDDLSCLRSTLGSAIDRRVPQQFGKLLRPAMSAFYDSSKVRSLQKEVDELLDLLEVKICSEPACKRRIVGGTSSGCKSSKAASSASTRAPCNRSQEISDNVIVSAIAGIGGVGKTTLARQVFNDERVKRYFDLRIWISVSDDFDVKRLTKEFIQSALKNSMQSDNLYSLQQVLTQGIVKSKFLLVLDDVWDDVYANQDNRWDNFLEPLKSSQEGSAILLTTRSQRVADMVNENRQFQLEGLPPTIFNEFFEACAFGANYHRVNSELNPIGKMIIPQLKRCPLAAETLGRLLKPMLEKEHWSWVAGRELWELKQEKYDILPVLRLSYLYLPRHLRSCFLFCSMYPKGHRFDKDTLVNNWIAAGLVEPCKGRKLESDAYQYFEELVHRSLLHKEASGESSNTMYIMHELMYDMAQLVSDNECFIVKCSEDLQKIPEDVRHLSIIGSSDLNETNLKKLCEYKKLRSIVCHGVNSDIITPAANHWFEVLTKIRMLSFLSCKLNYLPESIGNLKFLRYLNIGECTFQEFPLSFWQLQNLLIVDAQKCHVQHIPEDFNQQRGKLLRSKLANRIANEPGNFVF